jgi:hypothetical protein
MAFPGWKTGLHRIGMRRFGETVVAPLKLNGCDQR